MKLCKRKQKGKKKDARFKCKKCGAFAKKKKDICKPKKLIIIIILLTLAVAGNASAAKMEKSQVEGWTITRVYDEWGHFAGATLYDENGKKIEHCNDELCIARRIQERRRQIMQDPNTSDEERTVLASKHHDTAEKIRQTEANVSELKKSIG